MEESKVLRRKRGTKWLYFWENILLPLNVITGTIALFIYFQLSTLLFVSFIIATIIGLKKRRLWGYYLNFGLLIAITVNYPFFLNSPIQTARDFFIPFGIAATLILLPSAIYFGNRKYLFNRTNNKSPINHDQIPQDTDDRESEY